MHCMGANSNEEVQPFNQPLFLHLIACMSQSPALSYLLFHFHFYFHFHFLLHFLFLILILFLIFLSLYPFSLPPLVQYGAKPKRCSLVAENQQKSFAKLGYVTAEKPSSPLCLWA